MNYATWFHEQIKANSDVLFWALDELPPERLAAEPPERLGLWSVQRHIYHLWVYEQYIALQAMQNWLPELPRISDAEREQMWNSQDEQWTTVAWDDLIERFRAVRQVQFDCFEQIEEATWAKLAPTIWDQKSLKWIVSKTLQHTIEHTNTIMRIWLFWDMQK